MFASPGGVRLHGHADRQERADQLGGGQDWCGYVILAIFYPFSQFCEIDVPLLSL